MCLPEQCRPTSKQAPLLLCQISSAWRQIALGMPHLWSNLYISKQDFTSRPSNHHSPASVAKQWLSRSGISAPLSLRLDYIDRSSLAPLIQEVLIPYAHRYSNLILHGHSSISNRTCSLTPFLEMPPGRVDQLESLILSLDDEVEGPVTVFETAPRLRRASLTCVTFDGQVSISVRLPWAQLTHLTLSEFLLPTVWVIIMTQCIKLQKGVFNITMLHASDEPFLSSEDSVTFHDLHDLGVMFMQGSTSYFTGLYFPSLTRLRLRSHSLFSNLPGFFWLEPNHFLHQLRGLHRISLIGTTATTRELIELLRMTPALVELELDNALDYTQLFQSLVYAPGQDVLVPKLAEVVVYMQDMEVNTFSDDIFVDMVHSRQSAAEVESLRRISVYFTDAYGAVMDSMRVKLGCNLGPSVGLEMIDSSQTLRATVGGDILGQW
jgi:hypothetical protein